MDYDADRIYKKYGAIPPLWCQSMLMHDKLLTDLALTDQAAYHK